MPDVRLWMVGDGSERPAMERLAAELGIAGQVTFWGQQLDVAPFFSAADAFIMSSQSEGLPVSLLQAFSLGLPAIVTDVGGMAEVVRLAKAGFTVSATDPAEMAAAILRMAGSDAERKQFATNARSSIPLALYSANDGRCLHGALPGYSESTAMRWALITSDHGYRLIVAIAQSSSEFGLLRATTIPNMPMGSDDRKGSILQWHSKNFGRCVRENPLRISSLLNSPQVQL